MRSANSVVRGALAGLLVQAALWLRQSLQAYFHLVLPTYMFFCAIVMLISMRFGLWFGCGSTALSAILIEYFILKPTGSWQIQSSNDAINLGIFCAICVAISVIAERLRENERRLVVQKKDEELRESRDQLQLFIEHSMTSVAMFDREMRYLTVSEVWIKEFGLTRQGMVGRSHYEVFPEIDEHWRAIHSRGLEGETIRCEEDRFVRQDGSVHWLRWEVRPWTNREGKVGGIVIFTDDITEKMVSAEALRETRATMDLALHCTPDAIFISDAVGNFLHLNESFASFHKFHSIDECARKLAEYPALFEVCDLRGVQIPLESWPVSRALRGETATNVECRVRRKDTGESWVGSYNFSPLRDKDSAIVGSIVSARDVTEQKHAAEALKKSEARFRRLFEDNGSIFLLIDPMNGTILDANHAAAAFYGYTREEMRKMLITAINTGGEAALAEHREGVLSGEKRRFDWTHRLASGEERQVDVFSSPVENNGRKVLFCVVRDVTDIRKTELLLQLSEERYRAAFQASLDAILITDFESGRIVESNVAFQQMLGFSKEEMEGKTTTELALWVDKGSRARMLDSLLAIGSFRDFEFRFRCRDGAIRWGLMSASPFEVVGRHCILSVLRDVTESKAAAERLRHSEERYRTAFQTSIDAIAITRLLDGVYIDVNHRFRDITGFEREEVLGKTAMDIGIWADLGDRENLVKTLSERWSCRDMQTRFRKKSGDFFWSMISVSRIDLDGEACMMSIIRDISEAKMAEEQIRNLAYIDSLTGLANRRLLLERLRPSETLQEATRGNRALVFIDLDSFRVLNDAMGHVAGDLVLRETGLRLTNCVREAGTVARTGGDEFAILLQGLDENLEEAAAQAGAISETALAQIELPFRLEEREWSLSCFIGITVFQEGNNNLTQVMQQADIAMTQARAAGRGSIRFFAPALQAAVNARATLEDEIRQGLRNGEFLLYYQPQVEREKILGAEVLLRWMHPRRGLLNPKDFIALAEETRLIVPLGEWALETACVQIAKWAGSVRTAGLHLAVNVSPLEVRKTDFVPRVLAILDRTGANPGNLKLEITETMLMENVEEIIAKMQALKERGLRFSIDDFGTGYSSLSYLKRFPVDQLKIDISFVRDILVDASSSAIASTIILLSRAMGLSVIAEGVESVEQRDHIAALGCHAYQGYLFSRPVPLKEFECLLAPSEGTETAE